MKSECGDKMCTFFYVAISEAGHVYPKLEAGKLNSI